MGPCAGRPHVATCSSQGGARLCQGKWEGVDTWDESFTSIGFSGFMLTKFVGLSAKGGTLEGVYSWGNTRTPRRNVYEEVAVLPDVSSRLKKGAVLLSKR